VEERDIPADVIARGGIWNKKQSAAPPADCCVKNDKLTFPWPLAFVPSGPENRGISRGTTPKKKRRRLRRPQGVRAARTMKKKLAALNAHTD